MSGGPIGNGMSYFGLIRIDPPANMKAEDLQKLLKDIWTVLDAHPTANAAIVKEARVSNDKAANMLTFQFAQDNAKKPS